MKDMTPKEIGAISGGIARDPRYIQLVPDRVEPERVPFPTPVPRQVAW